MKSNKTWVFSFRESDRVDDYTGGGREKARALLGGKGAHLAEMTSLGVSVPAGFTITTEACNAYRDGGNELPQGMWEQVIAALQDMEKESGKTFGDPESPLLVSCRSGAKISMPGMMDTVLNIGLNDEVLEGMVRLTEDARFVHDSYRRLIQMFSSVVLGVPEEPFEKVLAEHRKKRGVRSDSELQAEDLAAVVSAFKEIVRQHAARPFPSDVREQLRLATEAVFKSWNSNRAVDYRNAAGIPHDLGTAVNIQTMVFGNMGQDSASGVAMSRNATVGDNQIQGDYLTNAQGEDVVAGIRQTKPIRQLGTEMPALYAEFEKIAQRLEEHYREMQDLEFTIERGKLWILQTRTGKRTAQAAVRIAVDMAEEGLISRDEALMRIEPEQVDFFLHPQLTHEARQQAKESGGLLATGLNVSPGAAVGVVALDADQAAKWVKEDGKQVIMVRPETKPDDVHGMLAAEGMVTSRGGSTSHAALVARQFGKPAVVGVGSLEIDMSARFMRVGAVKIEEGEWISIDGATGEVYAGKLETKIPDTMDPSLVKLLGWADERRRLGVWTNADYPKDAERAMQYGAQGIGLCRTEHMFFGPHRLPVVQKMITAKSPEERREALDQLVPFQREDFAGLFRAMKGLPVIIRLIDPPLHEFLPSFEELTHSIAEQKARLPLAATPEETEGILEQIREGERMLDRVESLRETNPMLGLRGVRLGLLMPELTRMQVRAIFEAACTVLGEGTDVRPEVMIPLTSHVNEIRRQREIVEAVGQQVMEEQGTNVQYKFGTMIEIPRAALTADEIAEDAEFMSFGTNDLTQTTYGISRDDAESSFLVHYLTEEILPENPFTSIDENGVGYLMDIAIQKARSTRPDIEIGICGEHGGDPKSIALVHRLGINYVSCSPYRVPVARLAAAKAAIVHPEESELRAPAPPRKPGLPV